MGFLADEVDVHNRHEEEALFPVLERYVEGPTEVMRDEHRMLKRELKKLQAAVTKISPSRPTAASLQTRPHPRTDRDPEVREPHSQREQHSVSACPEVPDAGCATGDRTPAGLTARSHHHPP